MPATPPRRATTRVRPPAGPHQLWGCLSASQQQHVRTVLIRVAQQLLAHLPPSTTSGSSHACNLPLSQMKITPFHLERKAYLYPPIEPQAGA